MFKCKILHLEDNYTDAKLTKAILQHDSIDADIQFVDDKASYLNALKNTSFDLILSDFNVLDFSGEEALDIAQEVAPNTPFILLSGAVGDEKSSDMIKRGATDYVLKDNIKRLPTAVRRAVEEARIRHQQDEKEDIFHEVITQTETGFFQLDEHLHVSFGNEYFWSLTQNTEKKESQLLFSHLFMSDEKHKIDEFINTNADELVLETQLLTSGLWVRCHVKRRKDPTEKSKSYIGSMIDISSLKEVEKKLQDKITELKLVHEGTEVVSNADSFDKALKSCLSLVCDVIGWPIGHVYLPDKKSQLLMPTNIWYLENEARLKEFVVETMSLKFVRGEGLPGRIWKSKKPLWIKNVLEDERYTRAKVCRDLKITSALGFPILSSDGSLEAVFEIYSYDNVALESSMIAIVKLLGEQVGLVFERKKAEKRLEKLAMYDSVTALPNRMHMIRLIDDLVSRCQRSNTTMGVLYIDIDNFKLVNDTYKESIGDALLEKMSKRLQSLIRMTDILGRIGGDEFMIVMTPVNRIDDLSQLAEKIIQRMHDLFSIDKVEIKVSVSIGICSYPEGGETVDTLIKHAEVAMGRAKELGKNNYQYFTPRLNEVNKRRIELGRELRTVLQNKELYLVYQPQINMQTGQVVGLEALVRWHSDPLGDVSPVDFIPIAEASGMMDEIGGWILGEAFRQYKAWLDEWPELDLFLNVNCSIAQLQKPGFHRVISDGLKRHGISGSKVIIEVTETLLMEHVHEVKNQLDSINKLGVYTAIDDFGTGYASLSYLKLLPISILKIDQSFVKDMTEDKNDVAIVNAILQMAKALNLNVIAEGVETVDQMECLKDLGCVEAQGYYFSKPLEASLVLPYIKDKNLSS